VQLTIDLHVFQMFGSNFVLDTYISIFENYQLTVNELGYRYEKKKTEIRSARYHFRHSRGYIGYGMYFQIPKIRI